MRAKKPEGRATNPELARKATAGGSIRAKKPEGRARRRGQRLRRADTPVKGHTFGSSTGGGGDGRMA